MVLARPRRAPVSSVLSGISMATPRTGPQQSDEPVSDPRLIDLNSAVSEIRQACEESDGGAHHSPFFLIVGAGTSFPPVKLAASIIEDCRAVATRYKRKQQPKGAQTLDAYSHWFSLAYPSARQRQQYLRSLIEKKPLSLASLRLAHLLAAHKLTNLVVTTNFDDFIARALRLFGEEPAVCDHPRTVGRIDRDRGDIQIVHVHGSYLFYDCANLRGEVTDRARVDAETSFTMVGLLDSLLWTRSPLVLGYSGWEGDVIMGALKRRLLGGNPLAQSIYWFCFRRADMDRLPAWLRDSPDVRFVLPPEAPPEREVSARAATETPRRIRGTEALPEPTLPAFEVFDQLNRAFDIGPPALFKNPIGYLAKSLETALPETEGAAGDPYGFKGLVERLNRAALTFAKTTAPRGLEADLDRLRTLMRESQYNEALPLLRKIVPAQLRKLDEAGRREVQSAAGLVGSAVSAKLESGRAPAENLASVLVFDTRLDRMLGVLPEGTVWCVGSRMGQVGYERVIAGKSFGAFTYHLAETLRDPKADADGDGLISLLEATIEAGRRLRHADFPQMPVVSGDAAMAAFFGTRHQAATERARGTLHALLVGVGRHKVPGMQLNGPANDVARLAKALAMRDRRLFQRVVIRRLVDKEATRARFGEALRDLVAAQPEDAVLVYFSGHAGGREMETQTESPDGIFFVLYDYDHKGGGQASHREILDAFARAKAGCRIAILD